MQRTSVLFGQVLTVFGIVIAGVWNATQWAAVALGNPGTESYCQLYRQVILLGVDSHR